MKNIIALVMMALFISACGQGPQGLQGPKGDAGAPAPTPAPTPTPVVDEVQEDIDALLEDENDYRLGLGQTKLSEGLSCSVQAVNSGQWISNSSPGYNAGQGVISGGSNPTYSFLYKGDFNQPNTGTGAPNFIPTAIQPVFVGVNFVLRCTGFIVVRETDYYDFSLSSDDGSILTVDGTQVINNDGNHGITAKTGTKFLRRGVRSFSLTYAQTGGGNFALILKAGDESIDPRHYAH